MTPEHVHLWCGLELQGVPEIDLVIWDEKAGVFVVEVKAFGLDYISQLGPHEWKLGKDRIDNRPICRQWGSCMTSSASSSAEAGLLLGFRPLPHYLKSLATSGDGELRIRITGTSGLRRCCSKRTSRVATPCFEGAWNTSGKTPRPKGFRSAVQTRRQNFSAF